MITFATQPLFLHSRFEYVRLFLLGVDAIARETIEVSLEEGVEVTVRVPELHETTSPNLDNSSKQVKPVDEDENETKPVTLATKVTLPVRVEPPTAPAPLTAPTPLTTSEPLTAPTPPATPTPSVASTPPATLTSLTAPTPLTTSVSLKAPASPSLVKTIVHWILSGLVVFSLSIALVLILPQLYYVFFPSETVPIKAQEEGTVFGGDFEEGPTQVTTQKYLPPQDPSLPEGDWVVIPKIGVRSQPQATLNPDDALNTGVWQVPDFGKPGDTDIPMILVSHRFGWQWWWQTDYWKYHSFYLLPDLEPGDRVEFISDQRKWVYEIYAGEEGEEITDYEADLILYTCKYLNSPIRHFRYARLIDPTQDTQTSAPVAS